MPGGASSIPAFIPSVLGEGAEPPAPGLRARLLQGDGARKGGSCHPCTACLSRPRSVPLCPAPSLRPCQTRTWGQALHTGAPSSLCGHGGRTPALHQHPSGTALPSVLLHHQDPCSSPRRAGDPGHVWVQTRAGPGAWGVKTGAAMGSSAPEQPPQHPTPQRVQTPVLLQ